MAADPTSPVIETADLHAASHWRRHPYALLFPLGLLLAWAGIGHWFLHAVGVLRDYRPVFHAFAQIQGFMACLAAGFLLTMIPRRTGSAPPGRWTIAVAAAAPVATTTLAWFGWWRLSQLPWLLLLCTLVGFLLRRFLSRSAQRRPPVGFVWIPVALVFGLAGSLSMLLPASPSQTWLLHELGRGLVLQGVLLGLFLGVGSLALPLMTRGDAPADLTAALGSRVAIAAHVAAAALLGASFWVEVAWSLRLGLALRGAVVVSVLVAGVQLWRRPQRPGWSARLIWVAAWMVPLGYVLGAALPTRALAGLHVTFIGGFALLGLTVSAHVIVAHGGHRELALARPWQVAAMGALLLLSALCRVAMELDRRRYYPWMMLASAAFLLGTLTWANLTLPRLRRVPRLSPPHP